MTDAVGALSKRVQIWRPTVVEGAGGKVPGQVVLVATIWAGLKPDRGTAEIEGGRPVDKADVIMTVRGSDLTRSFGLDDRFKFNGATWRMKSADIESRLSGRIPIALVRESTP